MHWKTLVQWPGSIALMAGLILGGAALAGAESTTIAFPGGATLEMVRIEPGTFWMGTPETEPGRDADETRHQVTLTKAFWLGKYEVTQGQWQAVMGSNPSRAADCGSNCPVEWVSWKDCQEFLKKLNEGIVGPAFRLPTEAEWEYACRAGTETVFSTGECLSASQANFAANFPQKGCPEGESRQKLLPVGGYPPNPWGLYDMHGNVWEWCSDWYEGGTAGSVTDPTGPENGMDKIVRGGYWDGCGGFCRSGGRNGMTTGDRYGGLGLRLARSM